MVYSIFLIFIFICFLVILLFFMQNFPPSRAIWTWRWRVSPLAGDSHLPITNQAKRRQNSCNKNWKNSLGLIYICRVRMVFFFNFLVSIREMYGKNQSKMRWRNNVIVHNGKCYEFQVLFCLYSKHLPLYYIVTAFTFIFPYKIQKMDKYINCIFQNAQIDSVKAVLALISMQKQSLYALVFWIVVTVWFSEQRAVNKSPYIMFYYTACKYPHNVASGFLWSKQSVYTLCLYKSPPVISVTDLLGLKEELYP